MNSDKFGGGVIVLLVLFMIIVVLLLNSQQNIIKDLKADNINLKMMIGTNKLLIMDAQRKIISDEIALKEDLNE